MSMHANADADDYADAPIVQGMRPIPVIRSRGGSTLLSPPALPSGSLLLAHLPGTCTLLNPGTSSPPRARPRQRTWTYVSPLPPAPTLSLPPGRCPLLTSSSRTRDTSGGKGRVPFSRGHGMGRTLAPAEGGGTVSLPDVVLHQL